MERKRPRRKSWSELPAELILAIAERLENRADILHFRRVCKAWQASTPLFLLTSKHIISPLFPHYCSDEVRDSYTKVVVANSVFLLRSAVDPNLPPWLLSAEELIPGNFYVRFPLFRSFAHDDLPENFPYYLDLSRFHVLELGKFYNLRFVDYSSSVNLGLHSLCANADGWPLFPPSNKVVLFVEPKCQTVLPTIDDCTLVELSNDVPLYVKRLSKGKHYNVTFRGRKLDDIVNFKSQIYAIDRKGRVYAMDYYTLKMSTIVEEPLCEGSGGDNKKRLAVSNGELYLVYKWSKRRVSSWSSFKVFKLNEEEEKWVKLEGGIGNDRILFVTFDGCFFASAKEFPQWKGNCIISPSRSFPYYSRYGKYEHDVTISGDEVLQSILVFHLDNGVCEPLECYPGYSDVFWPPPSWLRTDDCLFPGRDDSEDQADNEEEEEGRGEEEEEEEEGEGEEYGDDNDNGDGGEESNEVEGQDEGGGENKFHSDSSCQFSPELLFEPDNSEEEEEGGGEVKEEEEGEEDDDDNDNDDGGEESNEVEGQDGGGGEYKLYSDSSFQFSPKLLFELDNNEEEGGGEEKEEEEGEEYGDDNDNDDGGEESNEVEGQDEGGGEYKLYSESSFQIAPEFLFEPNNVQGAKGIQTVQMDLSHEELNDQNGVDSTPPLNNLQNSEKDDVSQVRFVGVEVSSNLVSILQKIWNKHGNIIEGHVVNSDNLLTWALESLAKIIIILQSITVKSLDDSQSKFLESTLLDLRLMQFRLDWLVPFVEKALALHKNKVLMELEMEKSKLQTELLEVEARLAEQRKLVLGTSASVDIKDLLS